MRALSAALIFSILVCVLPLQASSCSALNRWLESPSTPRILALRGGAGTASPGSVAGGGGGGGGTGKQKLPTPSRPLSALKQSVLQPDDLWPSGPPPGDLHREHRGYLKPEHQKASSSASARIPNTLHRIIFLGTQRHISEEELLAVMDPTMAEAYSAWQRQNEGAGFRFELWNLASAEAYIAQHFQSNVLRAFQTLEPYAYKSDLFRYLVLYHQGGWYADLKLRMAHESADSLTALLDRLAGEVGLPATALGFVGTGQNMVWNVPGAEGLMNAFLGAKARHPVLGDAIVRVVDTINNGDKGRTAWSLTGPYALLVALGKRKGDAKKWQDWQGSGAEEEEHGGGGSGMACGLMRFGFDEWHLPASDTVVVRKAARGECGGGWGNIGGNNYVDMWFADSVFKSQ